MWSGYKLAMCETLMDSISAEKISCRFHSEYQLHVLMSIYGGLSSKVTTCQFIVINVSVSRGKMQKKEEKKRRASVEHPLLDLCSSRTDLTLETLNKL